MSRPSTDGAPPAADPRVLAAMTVTVLAWSSAFVVIRGVADAFDAGALALARLLVGSLALGGLLLLQRTWVRPSPRDWALVIACGLAWFAVYNVALNAAEQRLDAGTTAMLIGVGPLLIALLAGALLGEAPLMNGWRPRWLLVGAVVALAGVVVIGVATSTSPDADPVGVVLALLAAGTYAVGVLAQKPVLGRLPALQVTWLACTVGALACLPFAPRLARDTALAVTGELAGVLYLGLVPTALAFVLWGYALARTGAGRLAVTTYVVPPLTIATAWPALGEVPPPLALAGGALCLAGVALSRQRG